MSNAELLREFERAMIESGGAAQLERENPPIEITPAVETAPIAQRMGLAPKQPDHPHQTPEERIDLISQLHSRTPNRSGDFFREGTDPEGPGSQFRRPRR